MSLEDHLQALQAKSGGTAIPIPPGTTIYELTRTFDPDNPKGKSLEGVESEWCWFEKRFTAIWW